MELVKDIILDDCFKLKITSKKLSSGRFQVKFSATIKSDKCIYGYLLVEPSETLKSVIKKIRKRLNMLDQSDEYQHFHLYQIGRQHQEEPNFLIFE
ncbi:MAG: hypothetical protein AAF600_13685 [Bacteroidota bacterium]